MTRINENRVKELNESSRGTWSQDAVERMIARAEVDHNDADVRAEDVALAEAMKRVWRERPDKLNEAHEEALVEDSTRTHNRRLTMTRYAVYFVDPRANGPDVWTLSRPHGAPEAYDSRSDAEDYARRQADVWPKHYIDRKWVVVRQNTEEFPVAQFERSLSSGDAIRKVLTSQTSRI